MKNEMTPFILKRSLRAGTIAGFGGLLIISFYFLLPEPLFRDSLSTVLYSRDGYLLGAKIADDEQWRFPHSEIIPDKFRKAIIAFEDRHFYYHPGVNPFSLFRALYQNIREGQIVSGGSTLSMQVIRLSGKNRPRTIQEKLKEVLLALRLEAGYSKEEILVLYASNAPFGGNIVGLDAASWRYFGRRPGELSWAESAMLAVLPNAPALIHPGKNRELLLSKRNNLLKELFIYGEIDSVTCHLSMLEPLPDKPIPVPQYAPHLLSRIFASGKRKTVNSTLVKEKQERVSQILEEHHQQLKQNQIHNAAVIVAETETGNVLAYVGNTSGSEGENHGEQVDICMAPRSTGSILKPYLFAAMLDEGLILQNTLIPDIPTYLSGYTPKNFDPGYAGAIPAREALARSLNIPAVKMLKDYSVEKFYHKLKELGVTTISKNPDHYGLTLVLGGGEANLWELAGIYSGMARTLNHFPEYSGKYNNSDFRPLDYVMEDEQVVPVKLNALSETSILSAGSVWMTFEALREVNRPEQEAGWEYFTSARKIAWKTGTSFGFRDAWAIGTNRDYVVAVWVGNADGEGRPGLTGLNAAAPIMFDVFDLLPAGEWFDIPWDELVMVPICRQSGHRASVNCTQTDSLWILEQGLKSVACPYHQIVHLDPAEKYRVTDYCEAVEDMITQSWFVLPPVQEWYYKQRNAQYKVLPPFRKDCLDNINLNNMQFIYPDNGAQIYIPYEIDGSRGSAVFEVACSNTGTKLFWHLDDQYLGYTQSFHQMKLHPDKGKHIVTVVDELGSEALVAFEIVSE